MKDSYTKLRVGITVTLGVLILLLGYWWLTGFRFKKEKFHYKVRFKEVGWVKKGDAVTILGVPKGRVEDIKLYPESVVVYIWIEDYPLRAGANAWMESLGLLGQMRLGVRLGDGAILPQGTTIPGEMKKDIGDLIDNIGEFLANTESIIEKGLTLSTQVEKRFAELTEETKSTLFEVKKLISEIRLAVDVKSAKLDTLILGVDNLITKLEKIEDSLLEEEGTLGMLLKDDKLYREADSTVRALRELIEDIKQNPGKYIKLKVF